MFWQAIAKLSCSITSINHNLLVDIPITVCYLLRNIIYLSSKSIRDFQSLFCSNLNYEAECIVLELFLRFEKQPWDRVRIMIMCLPTFCSSFPATSWTIASVTWHVMGEAAIAVPLEKSASGKSMTGTHNRNKN